MFKKKLELNYKVLLKVQTKRGTSRNTSILLSFLYFLNCLKNCFKNNSFDIFISKHLKRHSETVRKKKCVKYKSMTYKENIYFIFPTNLFKLYLRKITRYFSFPQFITFLSQNCFDWFFFASHLKMSFRQLYLILVYAFVLRRRKKFYVYYAKETFICCPPKNYHTFNLFVSY